MHQDIRQGDIRQEGIRIQADADGTFTLYSASRIILRGLTRERAYRLAGQLGEFVEY